MKKIQILVPLLLFSLYALQAQKAVDTNVMAKVWSIEKATQWYNSHAWISGANYIPHTAINQLEMWQAETFDPETIDKELGWAEGIGFNTMRVFLHHLAWKQDPAGFKMRVDRYLTIADKHHIHTIFVFFDDCWNKVPHEGKQPEPKPGVHNSGWMQDPGDPASKDTAGFPDLEKYVKDILGTFGQDKRILLWDLYNEPGNSGKGETSLPLLTKVFQWARDVNPDQPLSAGLWAWDFKAFNAFQYLNSDIITYHCYEDAEKHLRIIQLLTLGGRPLICTEYMARTRNSRFSTVMPMLKENAVGAINWGFVAGKSNTIYAWDTPVPDGSEPAEWFHDIFRMDGTPYRKDETDLISRLNRSE